MKKLGIILIIISVLIVIFSCIDKCSLEKENQKNVDNYIENTSIVREEEISNNIENQQVVEENYSTKQVNYTAILEIPSINLKRGVVDNTKNFNSINYAISVDNSSKYPNEFGNFILYAHSGSSKIGYFNNLIKVNAGNDIYVYYKGIKYHYSIFDKYDIEKTGKAEVITSNKEKYITLITCNPKKNGYQVVLVGKYVDEIYY